MRIELSQDYLDKHLDIDFAVGCVLTDEQDAKIEIVKFTGYNDISDNGYSNDEIVVHFTDGTAMELETLDRAVFTERTLKPVSPDWFVEAVEEGSPTPNDAEHAETEQERERERLKAEAERLEMAEQLKFTRRLQKRLYRPIQHFTDTEIFAKVLGVPLALAEEVISDYGGNLAQMANSTPKQMQKISGIGESRSERLVAAFELGKRLARFHAQKEKITSPADVADLMMSKLRYLQKEVVVVLCLDTKGSVTDEGKINGDDLKWGKVLGESQIFEGTLNASVFHPREIFRFAIENAANSVILVHNHPSGDPQPSQEDIRATKQLIEAGNHIGIKVLDHIVIGDGIFVSLKEEHFI